jgi:hypothetical protein
MTRTNSNSNSNSQYYKDEQQLVRWDLLEDPKIIEQCQEQLQTNGVMVLEHFATPKGLIDLVEEVSNAPYNEVLERSHTPWQDQGDYSNYPSDHPRNFRLTSSVAFVGRQSLTRTPHQLGISMYNNNKLVDFCSQVAKKPLFRSQDENGSVYSYRIHATHKPEWHFDESHYTAILYLENNNNNNTNNGQGGGGGEFMLVPWCRPTKSKDDAQGHEIVRQVLMNGDLSSVRTVPAIPGTLVFFSGAHSFHRAARLVGGGSSSSSSRRLGLVFTFFETEGHANSDNVKDINKWDPEDHHQKDN